MIRVEEARRIVAEIDLVSPKVIVASLEQALGYTLAKNLYSPFDLLFAQINICLHPFQLSLLFVYKSQQRQNLIELKNDSPYFLILAFS